jgi:hypothetical protein
MPQGAPEACCRKSVHSTCFRAWTQIFGRGHTFSEEHHAQHLESITFMRFD